MPCDTVQISAIDLGAVRADVLAAAVNELGFTGDVLAGRVYGRLVIGGRGVSVGLQYVNKALQVSGTGLVDDVSAAVKRAYTKTLVTRQAARFGWRVKVGQGGKLLLQK